MKDVSVMRRAPGVATLAVACLLAALAVPVHCAAPSEAAFGCILALILNRAVAAWRPDWAAQ